eukprot:scaffold4635_cov267-Pinguiococcus_pyrenoidosus.AAC.20
MFVTSPNSVLSTRYGFTNDTSNLSLDRTVPSASSSRDTQIRACSVGFCRVTASSSNSVR